MSTGGGDQTSSFVLTPGSSVFPLPADQDTIKLLKELEQGQSLIKHTFESKIAKLRKEITASITEKISSLREQMRLEIARLDSKFEHLELKLTQQYSDNPKTVPPLEDDECCVIVQGLRQDSNEDIDSKMNKLVEAMGDTGLKINVKDSTRLD